MDMDMYMYMYMYTDMDTNTRQGYGRRTKPWMVNVQYEVITECTICSQHSTRKCDERVVETPLFHDVVNQT
jgi:hypothetical protein